MFFYTFMPKLFNMSLTASVAIVLVILLRLLLKKAPKVISYALWGVVLFRLLCPVSIGSHISLYNLFDAPVKESGAVSSVIEYVPSNIVHTEYPSVALPVPSISDVINETLPQGQEQLVADPLEAPMSFFTYVWMIGVLGMLIYSIATYIQLRRKLSVVIPLQDNIFIADDIKSPFVVGLFRPKIYLPCNLGEKEQEYIILHEQHHIKRLDHIVKALAFFALAIHWFNPLVWVAFILASKDMEMSCDEAVIHKIGGNVRADYSASLLTLATGRRIIAGTPLAFGEGNTKDRIKNLANWKKPAFWVVLVAVIACLVLAVCLLTNPTTHGDSITLINQSTPARGNAFTYDVSFGQNVMSGTVHAEQWSNGTCVKSSPVVLTSDVDEINILMNVRRENNSPVGVDIQVDTNEYGGSLITYFAFPENNSIIGWGCKGYELNEPVQIHPDTEKILAALVFDVGNGVRAFGTEDLIIEPERLENADYAIVIRASFDSTNLGNENNEATPIYSTFNATVLEIHDGYYLVEPVEGSWELSSADRIEVPIRNAVPSPEPEVGDVIEIEYSGEILETYPARIEDVCGIKLVEGVVTESNDLIDAFRRSIGDEETLLVTDHVYADDEAYGLEGVVQYADETGTPWKLAFIRDGVAFPTSMDFSAEYRIASELTYLGNGAVQVHVENLNDGTFHVCRMEYSYDETEKQTNFKAITEEYRSLTAEEIAKVNETFSPLVFDKQGNPISVNTWSCFFTSYYDDVREMHFEEFLAYFPGDGSTVDEEEFAALKELENFLFYGEVSKLSDMPVPVHRYPRRIVDLVLGEYAGISTADLDTSGVEYLPDYDAFYNYTSDAGHGMFICTRGEVVGDIVRLYEEMDYGTDMLTLQKVGNSYRIVSHQNISD